MYSIYIVGSTHTHALSLLYIHCGQYTHTCLVTTLYTLWAVHTHMPCHYSIFLRISTLLSNLGNILNANVAPSFNLTINSYETNACPIQWDRIKNIEYNCVFNIILKTQNIKRRKNTQWTLLLASILNTFSYVHTNVWLVGLLWLTPLPIIFQLYCGGIFNSIYFFLQTMCISEKCW
jgi:hypothetical protein